MKRHVIYLLPIFFLGCIHTGETLFSLLPPSETGVTFKNEIQSNDTLNAFIFTNFYNGGGVGIADFNLDGLPDLCFTANQNDPELYMGKGNMLFDRVESSGLQNPGWVTGISIVDINQDGWPDIYLSMAYHNALRKTSNQLYINQKTTVPSFTEEASKYGLAYDGFTMQTTFFDYDLDGDLDAYLLNTFPDGHNPNILRKSLNDGSQPSSDRLYENRGRQADGSYRYVDVSQKAGILYEGLGLGVAVADFNQDGFPDVYTSNDFQSDDALYLNNGDGTFNNVIKEVVKHTSLFGMGIDVADFNNDLGRDILQLDMLPEDNRRNKMMIAEADYEKKNLSVSPQYDYNLQYIRNTLQVLQGVENGLPFFSEQGLMHNIATTDWSWSILWADFDLDGWKDVHISNGYRKNITDLDFIKFNKNRRLYPEGNQFDREEYLQQIPEIKLRNYAFKNRPHSSFLDVSTLWGLDQLSYSNGAAFADLDLDGDLDLVVNNIDEPAYIYKNNNSTNGSIQVSFKGNDGNLFGIGASLEIWVGNQSQLYDHYPVKGYQSSMHSPLIIGIGQQLRVDSLKITWPSGNEQIIYDIPVGEKLQLNENEATYSQQTVQPQPMLLQDVQDVINYHHQESDFIDFRQTATLQKMTTRNGPDLASGDFNGDGLEDIVVGGSFQGSPTVAFTQSPQGKFIVFDTLPTQDMEVGAIAIFDKDQNGMDDILLVSGPNELSITANSVYQPRLYVASSKGFVEDSLPKLELTSECALVYDFNNDGSDDILLAGSYVPGAYPTATSSVLLEQGPDGFLVSRPEWLSNHEAIFDMQLVDIDQDQDLDILYTGHWQGVILLRNDQNQFNKEELSIPYGWWNCLTSADLDGDGDLDLVLGNEGLNSIFKASKEKPVTLWSKDFNNDGSLDPIWGTYLKDENVPIHPLGTLTKQIVQFRKRYTTFGEYAQDELDDLFTSSDLENAVQHQVTELRSVVAINQGNDAFSIHPLPFSVQKSPVQDILVEDFNQDGIGDLLLIGNFYPNEAIYGQLDASYGSLVLGTGNGSFKEMVYSESGLKIDGDARHLLYLKDENLIFVTQNQDPVITLRLKQNGLEQNNDDID